MRYIAIIQARMASTRLPGKVLKDISGKPMLERVVERVASARTLDAIMVATSDRTADDEIERLSSKIGIDCFRGSENDVLDRYYHAALSREADVIVRLTADCPLLDGKVIDKVVSSFGDGEYDYVSNTIIPTYPDGLDTEVFLFTALRKAWLSAHLLSEREHVTPYIRNHPELFKLKNIVHHYDLSHLRWTVDVERDLRFVCAVYSLMGNNHFDMTDVLSALQEHKDLTDINAGIMRNEGYQKSLEEDGVAF